jgi:hypothetical protein
LKFIERERIEERGDCSPVKLEKAFVEGVFKVEKEEET